MTTTNQSIFQVALPQGNIAKYEKKKDTLVGHVTVTI